MRSVRIGLYFFFFWRERLSGQRELSRRTGGIAQLVERQLCKLDVRSSNLLASTISDEWGEGEADGLRRTAG